MILGQLLRYCLAGVTHNLVGYLLYLTATYFGVEPKVAVSVLFLPAVAVSFLLNRTWAFKDRNPMAGSAWRFLLVYAGGYLVNLAVLAIFVDRLGYPHQWVQGFAIIGIAGTTFLVNRYFVFSASRAQRAPSQTGP